MGSKYIIKNATVVSVDKTIGNMENCDVLIEGAFISAVEPNLEHGKDCILIDGTYAIVSPGFIDTHRHTWQTQLRTITTDYVLADYILALRHIYGSCYSAHDAYMGNYCGALESIDNGITCKQTNGQQADSNHVVATWRFTWIELPVVAHPFLS
jgi:cytosine/adenosine deaminase-related metal-dependent hydrolase